MTRVLPVGLGPGGGVPDGGGVSVPVTVVVATRDRRACLVEALGHLRALPEQPPIIVVDNASSDGTPDHVNRAFPEVRVIRLSENRGAAARTFGVEAASTPFVAFADDDSWWAPGSLRLAARSFEASPRLAVVAARVLVGVDERVDATSQLMARSPLPMVEGVPGVPVLGFIACGAVVRRHAYLEVGGFDPLVFFLGEEQPLAIDLARAGWHLAYLDDVVAHHHPATADRDSTARRRLQARNELITAWTRRSAGSAVAATVHAGRAARDPAWRGALLDAGRRFPTALRRRRPPPPQLERHLRLLERSP